MKASGKWEKLIKNDVLDSEIKATPLAKKVAIDQDIDLFGVEGTGYQRKST